MNLPPGEILNQIFSDDNHLAWDAFPGALSYNVYRGVLGSLVDANADGAADGYGTCFDHDLISPADSDGAAPAAGAGFFYLITGRNGLGEGTLGRASSGAARPNTSPCP